MMRMDEGRSRPPSSGRIDSPEPDQEQYLETLDLLYLWRLLPPAVFRDLCLHARVRRQLLVPKSIDSSRHRIGPSAVAVDLLLIVLFGLQHSIMARPGFKRIWTRLVPQPIERSTYVLASCVVTALPDVAVAGHDVVIWDVQHPLGRWLCGGCSPPAGCWSRRSAS